MCYALPPAAHLLDGGVVSTQQQVNGGLAERLQTLNGQVLLSSGGTGRETQELRLRGQRVCEQAKGSCTSEHAGRVCETSVAKHWYFEVLGK